VYARKNLFKLRTPLVFQQTTATDLEFSIFLKRLSVARLDFFLKGFASDVIFLDLQGQNKKK